MKKLYSKGEEIFNGVSHIVGGGIGVIALIILIVFACIKDVDTLGLLSLIIYGVSMIILYTMSSLYHMISHNTAKKVFRIFDHCSIFLLIFGSYVPISLVLSVTETSIIFIIPIPPTRSEIAAIPARSIDIVSVTSSMVSSTSD